jgi:hypothetical protein
MNTNTTFPTQGDRLTSVLSPAFSSVSLAFLCFLAFHLCISRNIATLSVPITRSRR